MKEENSTKLDNINDIKWEYGYAIRFAILSVWCRLLSVA